MAETDAKSLFRRPIPIPTPAARPPVTPLPPVAPNPRTPRPTGRLASQLQEFCLERAARAQTYRRDRMRELGWGLVQAGLLVLVLTIPVVRAMNEIASEQTLAYLRMTGVYHPTEWVGPGGGILLTAVLAGFGVLLLAIRRAELAGPGDEPGRVSWCVLFLWGVALCLRWFNEEVVRPKGGTKR